VESEGAAVAILETYREKRDFNITPEPGPVEQKRTGPLTFVVQKHAARRLHYDFRLELDGVLKSWAVPKGPSLNTADKRLAVMVEDHPLDYASFEGVIPKGQYGAGEVIVWDSGTYSPDEDGALSFDDRDEAERRMREGIAKGKISINMVGQKLRGSWTLVKSRRSANEWLLIKHQDEYADPNRDILEEDASIASGQTIAALKGIEPEPARPAAELPDLATIPGARKGPLPKNLVPMLPSLTEKPFSHPDWIFEPKLDGVRVMSVVADGSAQLLARRGTSVTSQYPVVAADLPRRCEGPAVFDGEVVALDADGRPSFHLLAHRMHLSNPADIRVAETQIPVVYYLFDLLYLGEYDLRGVAVETRKELLKQVVAPSHRIMLLDHFSEIGEIAYEAALEHGLEGIVAKKRGSAYEVGKRSRQWLKVKGTTTDDFVVGGYTEGQGERAGTFGALLVGTWEKDGRLRYRANVGTGFDHRLLDDLLQRLEALKTDKCPFGERPPLKSPATWVRPELVVEVKFVERTPDGSLRAPVFMGLRDDKPPEQAQQQEFVTPPRTSRKGPRETGSDVAVDTDQNEVRRILDQLEDPHDNVVLDVQGIRVPTTNLKKILWPEAKGGPITKRDFIRYLATMSPYLLKHLRDRPLTLIRFPNGIHGQRFFQKHAEDRPEFVQMVRYFSKHNEGDQDYLLCNNLPTLIWLGQMAALELHSSYSRMNAEPDAAGIPESAEGSTEGFHSSVLNYPDFLVFDIDPYIYSGKEKPGDEPELNEHAFAVTCQAAVWIKEVLDSLGLKSFVKTTGRTGLHVFVPIVRQFTYDAVTATSEAIALHVLRQHPKELTTEWQVSKRPGKVFIDHNQGARGKTLASIYSPRAAAEASVSTPLRWEEMGNVYPTDFTIRTAPDRVADIGDLWSDILAAKQDLKALVAGN